MPHFMIVLILYMYINLLNHSWIKMSIFAEYRAFKLLRLLVMLIDVIIVLKNINLKYILLH